ncbi:uncharacterized protein LOC119983847 isoform X5 [Tripterygium wilfordii]|uniref:uncharacterized protein LOC119983847 isoform X5 n=1 Tax=Tripterygium wilfordii TaxID=458696 RepID=UPI0018F864D4|nr:uncharacterized protein LOC119983847 isoform X5 [Tripterygium wilfordii]
MEYARWLEEDHQYMSELHTALRDIYWKGKQEPYSHTSLHKCQHSSSTCSVIDYMGTCELDLTQAYLGSPSILPRSMELYLRFRPLSRKLSSFSFNQVRRIGFSHIIELSFPLTF